MNLHLKQRALERLRMPNIRVSFSGSGYVIGHREMRSMEQSAVGAPIWRALQGAQDRIEPNPVAEERPNPAIEAPVYYHRTEPDPMLAKMSKWIDRAYSIVMGIFQVCLIVAAFFIMQRLVAFSIEHMRRCPIFQNESQTTNHLSAPQAEKGGVAR